MSPEMVNEMTYDERSDIWALGCLLYEMATLAYVLLVRCVDSWWVSKING